MDIHLPCSSGCRGCFGWHTVCNTREAEHYINLVYITSLRSYLGADNICVLISEVNVLNMPLQGHLMEVLVAVGALLPTITLLLARCVR